MKALNLIGHRVGRLSVVESAGSLGGSRVWLCKCDCGNLTTVKAHRLTGPRPTRSCGCLQKETVGAIGRKAMQDKAVDRTGSKYGRLTVVRQAERNQFGDIRWECVCECGNLVAVPVGSLTSEHTRSCGCLQREKASVQGKIIGAANHKHGMTETPEYHAWHGMRQRCLDKNHPGFKHWGGRGVKICDRWNEFKNFYADVGERPTPKHSLDRFPDPNGNYEPSNVRWATQKEQQRNRRRHRMVAYKGQSKCVGAWAEEAGLTVCQLWTRLFTHKWPVERAMSTPAKKRPRS